MTFTSFLRQGPLARIRQWSRVAGLLGAGLLLGSGAQALQFDTVHKLDAAGLGKYPEGALTVAADGRFYGLTTAGGPHGGGTLFVLNASGHPKVLHAFGDTAGDGWNWWRCAPLLATADGALYGSSQYGGATGNGALFKYDTTGGYSIVHGFTGADGSHPNGLIQGPDGMLYGSTVDGGSQGLGTVFKLDAAGQMTVLHQFSGGADGQHPTGLTLSPDGRLIIVTNAPSAKVRQHHRSQDVGAVFSMALDGSSHVLLHQFADRSPQGAGLYDPLLLAADGNYYGTSRWGGSHVNCCGLVFRMTPSGHVDILHAFGGHADGAYPRGTLIQAADGTLYGVTTGRNAGHKSGAYPGTLFAIAPDGSFQSLYQFPWFDGVSFPSTGLTLAGGALYGMTEQHQHQFSARIGGAVYRITP